MLCEGSLFVEIVLLIIRRRQLDTRGSFPRARIIGIAHFGRCFNHVHIRKCQIYKKKFEQIVDARYDKSSSEASFLPYTKLMLLKMSRY